MSAVRHVWLTPRDLRRDVGPVDALQVSDGGAWGELSYGARHGRRRAVTLVVSASGAGLATAAPLLAIGGEPGFATAAIGIAAFYAIALRLTMVARARDRTLSHHGCFLPRLSRLRPDRVRRRPLIAAMRLAQSFTARPRLDDAGDVATAALQRALLPVSAGLCLAGEGVRLCAAVCGAGLLAGAWAESRRLAAEFRAEWRASDFSRRAAHFVAAWPTLRAHGASDAAVESLRRRDPIAAKQRSVRATLRSATLCRFAIPALPIGVMLTAHMSPGVIIGLAVAAVASGQAGAVLGTQAARIVQSRRQRHSADRLFSPEIGEEQSVSRIEHLAVEDLAFRYPDAGAPVFQHLNFTLRGGEVLALASPSGSGKTTLLRILTALAEPSAGNVLVNGAASTSYRHRVAAVFQDEAIGAGTIRAAIAGGAGIGLDDAWEAAARVGADDLIRALPMEMQTLIVEGPFPPSLLQPLLIARALAQRPDLLILDEALGVLPYDRARTLLDDLRAKGVLVIFASHDPAMVALADKVVVLES